MKRNLLTIAAVGSLALGMGALLLTLYLWFGDWPQSVKASVDHFRSVAETEGQPPPPLIVNPGARARQSLNGRWNIIIDAAGVGESPLTAGMVPRNIRPQSPAELIEVSFEGGPTLEVPGDWNTQDERLFFYEGTVWYQRTFEHAAREGRRSFLYFGAANYRSSVYLNGKRIGGHRGGYTPFNFEATQDLIEGENLLVVMVDNRHTPADIPTQRTDWLNYGGLTRDVELLDVPETFVRDYTVELDPEAPDKIRGWLQLDGPKLSQEVTFAIPELGVLATVASDAAGRAEFSAAAQPELWAPGSPRLYEVELRSEDETVKDQIGFRTIAVDGLDIVLNGKPVFLRGISIHAEAPNLGGRASGEQDAETLLGWAVDLGCNFVRLSHYPHDEATLKLADRLGLLVWSEIPVYWNIDFENEHTLALGKQQLTEMIRRDANRASVILWSIGNETPVSDARNTFMKELADHVRLLDPTRPITAALLSGPAAVGEWMARDVIPSAAGLPNEEWVYKVGDPLGEIVDVAALNEYFGWYYATPLAAFTPLSSHEARQLVLDNLPRLVIETGVEKPLIVSEFGAGALAGMHAPEEELAVFSEEYQALVYRKQIAMLSQQDDVRGMSPWVLKDFRSALRTHPTLQDFWNRKGLIADDGTRKLAFDVLRDHYAERAKQAP